MILFPRIIKAKRNKEKGLSQVDFIPRNELAFLKTPITASLLWHPEY